MKKSRAALTTAAVRDTTAAAARRRPARRTGSADLVLDWRREPGPALAWRVYELAGSSISNRSLQIDTPGRRGRRAGAAVPAGGSRYFTVALRNDCGDESP
jgi:hypothetical protein